MRKNVLGFWPTGTLFISLLVIAVLFVATSSSATPLDDYVNTPDPAYTHGATPANTIVGAGYTAYVYYMASQTWRTPAEVDRTLWEHWVTILVPTTVSHTKAMMVISGGSNSATPPSSVNAAVAQIAVTTQSIIANISYIPNERLKFADETNPAYIVSGRTEDELIAYAWDKFKTTGDPTWLPRLPMTKAVMRAMDLVQELYPSIDGFFAVGASKRGWTTWTTAIADSRVQAMAPMVIDILNVEHSMQHHWDAYGYWAPSIHDYEDMGVMTWLHTDSFRAMNDVIDPYEYLSRLTIPKYVMNSTGDQFFLPDSSQYYFEALKGEKYLRYLPNTDHGIDSQVVTLQDLTAFYNAFLDGTPRPQFSWSYSYTDNAFHVQTVTAPTAVRLWQAANTTARNFRLDTIGAAWTSSLLADQGGGTYVGGAPAPAQGWKAFFVELEFAGPIYPFHFTTEVKILPETLPYRNVGGSKSIETVGTGTDTITLIRLAGTRYEMGYWYGRLLANDISAMWTTAQGLGITLTDYDNAIDAMWNSSYFDTTAWELEMRGVADGCSDAGHPEVTFRNLQRMQMLPDIGEYGCGLYAVWGNATADGSLYQLRNLDWTMDAGFQDHPVVAVYFPTDGVPHATIGFAGSIGAGGGGMNNYGIALSEIMGYFGDVETLNGVPFPFLMRDVLYHDTTLAQGLARMSAATRTNQYYYAIADPQAPDPKGRLMFTSNTRFDTYIDESVLSHPGFGTPPFHTSLNDVIYWKRHDGGGNLNLYNAIQSRYGAIGDTEAIDIAKADGVAGTLMSIVYHNTTREFWVAYANGLDPAQNQQYIHMDLIQDPDNDGIDNLFDTDDDGDGISDTLEGTGDVDGDGIPNSLDLDSDADLMPDSYEYTHGLNAYVDDAAGDVDGDTITNYQEYLNGTDPLDPLDPGTGMPAAGTWALAALAMLLAAGACVKMRALNR